MTLRRVTSLCDRVTRRTVPASMTAAQRWPSCLISWTHCGPVGSSFASTGAVSSKGGGSAGFLGIRSETELPRSTLHPNRSSFGLYAEHGDRKYSAK